MSEETTNEAPPGRMVVTDSDLIPAYDYELGRALSELVKSRAATLKIQRELDVARSEITKRDEMLAALAGEVGDAASPEVLARLRERYLVAAGNGSPTLVPELLEVGERDATE